MSEPAERVSAGSIWTEMRPQLRAAAPGLVAIVLGQLFTTAGPVLIGVAIDAGMVAHNGTALAVAMAGFALVSILSIPAAYVEWLYVGRFAVGYMRDLRVSLLRHLFSLDLDYFTNERSGRLVSRLTSDVENLQAFTEGGLSIALRASLSLSLTIIAMAVESLPLTLAVLTLAVPLAVATQWFRARAFPAQLQVRERMGRLLSRLDESLSGMRVIQAYAVEDEARRTFAVDNREAFDAKMATARLTVYYYPLVEFLQSVALAIVLGCGALLASRGDVKVGVVIAFVLLSGNLFGPVTQIVELNNIFQAAGASFAKLFEFRREQPRVASPPTAARFAPGRGMVCLEGVGFSYARGGRGVLHDITLTLQPGERVTLVGPSGAGKSTLARLVPRFYDPSEGRVVVDGQDVRDVDLASLRARVGLVPQEGFLFDGSVADNIRAARPQSSDGEVESACADLGILERLSALPDRLDTLITNRGLSLSGGQRQLVALARAYLADPLVLILDEATSNVDPATELLMELATTTALRDRTSLVIAHRIATAVRADRVILMAEGRIVEDGAPGDLLRRGGAFAEFARAAREHSPGGGPSR